jgi:hypothetical protein
MLRFRTALTAMTSTLVLVFLGGTVYAIVEGAFYGFEPAQSFDGYYGSAGTGRQIFDALVVAALISLGAFVGAYLKNPRVALRYAWHALASCISVVLVIATTFMVDVGLNGLNVGSSVFARICIEAALCFVPAVVGTWLTLLLGERRASAYA